MSSRASKALPQATSKFISAISCWELAKLEEVEFYFDSSANPCSRIESPFSSCASVITKGTSTRTTLL
jgi:hypothetical protein